MEKALLTNLTKGSLLNSVIVGNLIFCFLMWSNKSSKVISEIFFPRMFNLNPIKPSSLQEIEGLEDVKKKKKHIHTQRNNQIQNGALLQDNRADFNN